MSKSTPEKSGFFGRLRGRLGGGKGMRLSLSFTGRKLDAELEEELETQLLLADVGIEAAERIIAAMKKRVGRKEIVDEAVHHADKLVAEPRIAFQVMQVPKRSRLGTFLAQIMSQQVFGYEQSDVVACIRNDEIDLGGRFSVGKASRMDLRATPVDSGAGRG